MFRPVVLALAAGAGLMAPAAPAQVFGPPAAGRPDVGRPDVGRPPALGGPTVSPYLNLNRGGSPGVNYYGIVRPQIETAQSLQVIQQQQQSLGSALQQPPGQQAPLTTGHGAGFFNGSHYFPRRYPIMGTAAPPLGTMTPLVGTGIGIPGR